MKTLKRGTAISELDFAVGEFEFLLTLLLRLSSYTIIWLALCVDSSPLSSSVEQASSEVGRQVVLPCAFMVTSAQTPYIQWQTDVHTVFERMGEERFQGFPFKDRADVPMEMLAEGNCSLVLSDVRFSDAGIYRSYLLVGQSTLKKRILIHSVRLAVFDHKHMLTVEQGQDLILDLYTTQSQTLVFQQEGAPKWILLWQHGRSRRAGRRVEERKGMLVLPGVVGSDSGMYKVLDAEGLVLSTVKVSVTESKETEVKQKQISLDTNSGRVVAPCLCLTVVLLLSSHALLHLL